MACDCEIYEICRECAPTQEAYEKALAANNEAARSVQNREKRREKKNAQKGSPGKNAHTNSGS